MTGGGQGRGFGPMSRWFRRKPGDVPSQPEMDERGVHVGRAVDPGSTTTPGSQITDYLGLADRRLWDPEARAKFTDRNAAFPNERLRALSAGGLRWGGTMGSPRSFGAGTGAGLSGAPDDLRRLLMARLAGGDL